MSAMPRIWLMGPSGTVVDGNGIQLARVLSRDPYSPQARAVQCLVVAAPRMAAELLRLGDLVSPAIRAELAYIDARWALLPPDEAKSAPAQLPARVPEQRYGIHGRRHGD